MPLFGSKTEIAPAPAPAPVEEKHGLFSRHRDTVVEPAPAPVEEKHGMFSRNRNSTSSEPSIASNHSTRSNTTASTSAASTGRRTSLLRRDREDPSISAAREQVRSAEAAEADADRALVHARQAVKDAREQVRRLELEAAEEARLAKIKQDQAAAIGKRGKLLGRHDVHA